MNWNIWLSRFDLSTDAGRSRRLGLALVTILLCLLLMCVYVRLTVNDLGLIFRNGKQQRILPYGWSFIVSGWGRKWPGIGHSWWGDSESIILSLFCHRTGEGRDIIVHQGDLQQQLSSLYHSLHKTTGLNGENSFKNLRTTPRGAAINWMFG